MFSSNAGEMVWLWLIFNSFDSSDSPDDLLEANAEGERLIPTHVKARSLLN